MRMRVAALVLLTLALVSTAIAAQESASRPAAEPQRLFRFLAIGDPQYGTEERFKRWGDQLVAAEPLRPDFAIALGDLTSAGKPAEFEWYKAAIARPRYPVYSLPGAANSSDGLSAGPLPRMTPDAPSDQEHTRTG